MPSKNTNSPDKRPAKAPSRAKPQAKPKSAAKAPAKAESKRSTPERTQRDEAAIEARRSLVNQIMPYLLLCLALFTAVCFILSDKVGVVGSVIRSLCCGLFAGAGLTLPVFIVIIALFWKGDHEKRMVRFKWLFALCFMLFLSVLLHVLFTREGAPLAGFAESFDARGHWTEGLALRGGGAVGGLLGALLMRGFGMAGTLIVTLAALLCFGLLAFGLTPHALRVWIAYQLHELRERKRAEAEALDAEVARIEALRVKERFRVTRVNGAPVSGASDAGSSAQPGTLSRTAAERKNASKNDVLTGADAARRGERIEFDASTSDAEEGEYRPETEADAGDLIDSAVFEEVLKRSREQPASDAENDLPPFDPAAEPVRTSAGAAVGKSVENVENPADRAVETPSVGSVDKSARRAESLRPLRTPSAPEDAGQTDEDVIPAELLDRLTAPKSEAAPAETVSENISVSRERPFEPQKPEPPKREYKLPPPQLLKLEAPPKSTDISEELQTTAKKLVDTLASFKVRTHIVDVSRGPTITRYELAPEEGVRVRAIANLVDDIALNLATTGVRIEAPIPNKSAVGIEVPNRVIATVWLRELIENPQFAAAKSKITVALGMDVAGEPVYLNIAKMPHLLIAGATGMGKSVCINSMIVSLLCKATPDEVRLILVDPKKVELNIYNGLPHLLVPVVSDPKKAAGSLYWAVTEMERRFDLIEGAGVRDLENYNLYAEKHNEKLAEALEAGDPEAYSVDESSGEATPKSPLERIPQIVIIIDELADLMMTAPDDVEESICRLAQKARAAGMHLIIGTQRPSVDVITGLIKANIPSRIAFTTASQIDSRTIIDSAGAEKLIGRGDMLCLPVGAPKPVRVQGAYVSEGEVEEITKFIRDETADAGYDANVIADIERAAEQCGTTSKKKSAETAAALDGEDGEGDTMLRPAIELAIECGKISTSLIQRRLSLGYGRAAKLLDRMVELGFVSPPDGQKPRNVLITKQQYMEMVLNKDEIV